MSEKNALAELAERLYNINDYNRYPTIMELNDIRSAQRIVAELAKCWRPCAETELINDYVVAFANIREIAEKGVEDGKM